MKNKVVESVFDTMNAKTKPKDVVTTVDNTPDVTSPEWHEYVMKHFKEDELIDGKPIVSGLRRVAQLILGRILQSEPTNIFPPPQDDSIGRATIAWRVVFEDGSAFGDVASSWIGNTDEMFTIYTVETAATRAEARALRKALGLKIVSADEIAENVKSFDVVKKPSKTTTEGEYDDQGRMTDAQANFINVKAKKLNVNVEEFIAKEFNVFGAKKLSKKVASNAIDKLNEYQQKPESIPENVRGYLENWL
jgi:hypothetical protein